MLWFDNGVNGSGFRSAQIEGRRLLLQPRQPVGKGRLAFDQERRLSSRQHQGFRASKSCAKGIDRLRLAGRRACVCIASATPRVRQSPRHPASCGCWWIAPARTARCCLTFRLKPTAPFQTTSKNFFLASEHGSMSTAKPFTARVPGRNSAKARLRHAQMQRRPASLPRHVLACIDFTTKGDTLYAIAIGWPGEQAVITSLACGQSAGRQDRKRHPAWTPGRAGILSG